MPSCAALFVVIMSFLRVFCGGVTSRLTGAWCAVRVLMSMTNTGAIEDGRAGLLALRSSWGTPIKPELYHSDVNWIHSLATLPSLSLFITHMHRETSGDKH